MPFDHVPSYGNLPLGMKQADMDFEQNETMRCEMCGHIKFAFEIEEGLCSNCLHADSRKDSAEKDKPI